MEDRSHGGRVHHEADIETAALGDMQAEAALPGVFASGKTVTETASWRDHNGMNLLFKFSDGTSMQFSGTFTVEAQARGMADVDGADLTEHGKELMSGNFDPEEEHGKLIDELES